MPKTILVDAGSISIQGLASTIGPKVESVQLRSRSLKIELSPFELVLQEPAVLDVVLNGPDITEFVAAKLPSNLSNLVIRPDQGVLNVKLNIQMLVKVAAEGVCKLVIHGGKEIWIEAGKFSAVKINPQKLIQEQLDKYNPIFTLEDLPVEGVIESADCRDGKVFVSASVTRLKL